MEITRAGSRPSGTGPSDWFTGTVRLDPLFSAPAPARVAGAAVTFEPGARTAWHTHPLGQTLVVLFGRGLAQRESGPVEEIRPGDVRVETLADPTDPEAQPSSVARTTSSGSATASSRRERGES